MLQIRTLSLDNGDRPFELWISTQDRRSRAKIRAYIDRVALGGSQKNIKALGDGLNEIKINFGPGLRVYFGVIRSEVMILISGGSKATQSRDIEIARELWRQANASA
jgi:putative addiction module killer protein